MNYSEEALIFPCANENLFGILVRPEQASAVGVVIIVGGPQTRVGSHRQFVLIARALAAAGYPVLRFDYRGMGDSTGDQRDFTAVNQDINAAIDKLQSTCPGVTRIVLWGLCDAAAAALLYWDETRDPRIAGLCLLNPWVRSAETLARTQVKHYYGQRMLQKEFWLKLLRGQLNIIAAMAGLLDKIKQSVVPAGGGNGTVTAFQDRMARALGTFPGATLLLLGANDYTAKEFLEYAASAPAMRVALEQPGIARIDIAAADHTFSSAVWRDAVAQACLDWLGESAKLSSPALKPAASRQ